MENESARLKVSLDTTITDFAKFAAAVVRGDGLIAASHDDIASQAG